MITVLRFKDFQGPFTSNSKTFKGLFHFQGLSRPWKNEHFFKDFQGPVATLIHIFIFTCNLPDGHTEPCMVTFMETDTEDDQGSAGLITFQMIAR